jgi:hypothetical protein
MVSSSAATMRSMMGAAASAALGWLKAASSDLSAWLFTYAVSAH